MKMFVCVEILHIDKKESGEYDVLLLTVSLIHELVTVKPRPQTRVRQEIHSGLSY